MEKYGDRVVIISVDVDPKENDAKIRAYIEENQTPWIYARDTDNVLTKYQATGTGLVYVIDREGNIRATLAGATQEQLEAVISKL